jgi:hypothetical protein
MLGGLRCVRCVGARGLAWAAFAGRWVRKTLKQSRSHEIAMKARRLFVAFLMVFSVAAADIDHCSTTDGAKVRTPLMRQRRQRFLGEKAGGFGHAIRSSHREWRYPGAAERANRLCQTLSELNAHSCWVASKGPARSDSHAAQVSTYTTTVDRNLDPRVRSTVRRLRLMPLWGRLLLIRCLKRVERLMSVVAALPA